MLPIHMGIGINPYSGAGGNRIFINAALCFDRGTVHQTSKQINPDVSHWSGAILSAVSPTIMAIKKIYQCGNPGITPAVE